MATIGELLDRGTAWYRTLHQTEHWRTQEGELLRVDEMRKGHLEAVLALLERRAPRLAELCSWALVAMPMPAEHTMAHELVEADVDREWAHQMEDPLGWVRQTPLYRAMRERHDAMIEWRADDGRG